MRQLYLGIDLGTTNSKAAYLDFRGSAQGDPKPLTLTQHIELNKKVDWQHLPSVVMFPKEPPRTVFVGEYPRRYQSQFPDRTIRSIKRLMGKNWQYTVPGYDIVWTPESISALILKHLRMQALETLHDTQDDLRTAAISVPASFGGRQREATIEAAKLAGFTEDVKLIDEPSAVLIHYLSDAWWKGIDLPKSSNVLVFDMGGGTLDVSLAKVESSLDQVQLEILARSRYTELAGIEFDLRLAAAVLWILEKKGINLPDDVDARRMLLRAVFHNLAEPLKIEMSGFIKRHYQWTYLTKGDPFNDNVWKTNISIAPIEREILVGGDVVELPDIQFSFEDFMTVTEPFFVPVDEENNPFGIGTIYGPIHMTLQDAGLSKEDIDTVLLHGGMSQLRVIEAGLKKFFPPGVTEVKPSPDPMTSVAQGAALYLAAGDDRIKDIAIKEPALFESIFIESESGFQLVVDKERRVGDTGNARLSFGKPTKKVSLRFYQGFNANDPFLNFDHASQIELPAGTGLRELQLKWKIENNRNVTWEWRTPDDDQGWKPLPRSDYSQNQVTIADQTTEIIRVLNKIQPS